MASSDPTRTPGRLAPLRALLADLDAQIAQVYKARGLHRVRPRYAYPLIRLAHAGPSSVRELAESLGHTHSAVSQTLAALRREGLVTSEPGPDARTRRIALTERGRALVPFLEAKWRATEAAVAELDDECLPTSLGAAVEAMRTALARRGLQDRIADRLGDLSPPPPG